MRGDGLEIAFRLEENDHPDFGGLQLILQDFRKTEAAPAKLAATESASVR
jgi:hypothetical protein